MKTDDIKKNYELKIKNYVKHNKLYYEKNKPIINDSDFDKLKIEIIELEKKYSFLNHKYSPKKTVGYKPSRSFEKYRHKSPMLSLSNAFDEEDIENFEKKIFNFLNEKIPLDYSVEPKIDGISASLTYKNKKLILGVSRGDGKNGEIITDNLKTIKDIPLKKIILPIQEMLRQVLYDRKIRMRQKKFH